MGKQTFSDEAITQYLLGALPEADTERLDELSLTDDEFADSLKAAEKDLVDAYIQGELTGATLEHFKSHYLASSLRREKVAFAQAFQVFAERGAADLQTKGSVETKPGWFSALSAFITPRPALQWGLAAAALVLLTAGGLLVVLNIRQRQQAEQNQAKRDEQNKQEMQRELARESSATPIPNASGTPTLTPEVSKAPLIAELNDSQDRITLNQEGRLSGVDNLLPSYQRMVEEALTNQQLKKSSLLAGLNRPASSLMGSDDQGNNFSVTTPVGKVVLSERPTLRWSPLTGATNYLVEVYDEKFNLVATSSQLTADSWTVTQPLKRGQVYSWQVKAIKDGQEFKSPRPPAPQANFRILDQAKANELAQAQRAYASSHLTLGLLYAQDGLLDEAEAEFRALQKANPNSAVARRLMASVRAMQR